MSCPATYNGCILIEQVLLPGGRCFCVYRCDDGSQFWTPCPG